MSISRIGYLPPGKTSVYDILWLDFMVQMLSRWSRRLSCYPRHHISILPYLTCDECGAKGKIEIHHIKPVWMCAVDTILGEPPASKDDLDRLHDKGVRGEIDLAVYHTKENLRNLCVLCHTKADKIAYRFWKSHLIKNYPIVWTGRDLKRMRELCDDMG